MHSAIRTPVLCQLISRRVPASVSAACVGILRLPRDTQATNMASIEHPAPSGPTLTQTNSLHLDPSAFVEDLYNAVSVDGRQLGCAERLQTEPR
jgi:hypothetical protein